MKKLIIILIMLASYPAFSQPFAPKTKEFNFEHRTKRFKKSDATKHLKFAGNKSGYKHKKNRRTR
jgi:hypothetical protein